MLVSKETHDETPGVFLHSHISIKASPRTSKYTWFNMSHTVGLLSKQRLGMHTRCILVFEEALIVWHHIHVDHANTLCAGTFLQLSAHLKTTFLATCKPPGVSIKKTLPAPLSRTRTRARTVSSILKLQNEQQKYTQLTLVIQTWLWFNGSSKLLWPARPAKYRPHPVNVHSLSSKFPINLMTASVSWTYPLWPTTLHPIRQRKDAL